MVLQADSHDVSLVKNIIACHVPLTVLNFSTALCGAFTSVSFVRSEFTCVLCSKQCCKTCKMLPKSTKLMVSAGNISSLDSANRHYKFI